MLQPKGRSPFGPNSRGANPPPHHASAEPDCRSASMLGSTMQRGEGSKLKRLMGHASDPHADAAFRPIGSVGPPMGLTCKAHGHGAARPMGEVRIHATLAAVQLRQHKPKEETP